MRAWMVRAGSDGQREQQALSDGVLLPGWTTVTEDLSSCDSHDDLRSLVRSVHGDEKSERTLGSWAGQMWRFVNVMEDGDIVVMPMKHEWGKIAVGRIDGPYRFDAEAPPGSQHQRPVKWAADLIQKDSLGLDLQASLGALPTICELARNQAAHRLQDVFVHGEDPMTASSDESLPEEYLADLAQRVEKGERPSTTVRDLLARWGYYRRTSNSVEAVTTALSQYGLLAVPPMTEGAIDSEVLFVSDGEQEVDGSSAETSNEPHKVTEEQISTAQRASQEAVSGEIRYAVGSLPSARHAVESVRPSTPLAQALTTMALKSFSQLAVTDMENRLVGTVTWESIAMAWASGTPRTVRDAMVEAQSVTTTEELLSLTPRISAHGYVFVRDADGRVQGIVTAADLTQKFGDDQAPLIQLDEIERRLGAHVRERCSDEDLSANDVRVPASGKTLGTYVTALKREPLWEKLGWHGVDREMLHSMMDRVRQIRNDVMHFSPDPITTEELDILASAMRTLRLITDDPEAT